MKPYIYMLKIKFLLLFTYKAEIYISLSTYMILLISTAFFWKAAFNGFEHLAGISEQQILIYTIMSLLIRNWHSITVEKNIRNRIRLGDISVDLIKPINIFCMYFAEDIGQTITSIVQCTLPLVICSAFFVTKPIPASIGHFSLFIISFCLGYLVLWLISLLFGLLYFRFIDLGPLSDIKDSILAFLSGSFVPFWFFSERIQSISNFLPFIYIYQFPIGIYIGKYTIFESMMGCCWQIAWILFFLYAFHKIEKHIENIILIQGG